MEFLIVSDKKLKVILTKEDAEKMNFAVADADYDTADNRRTFRKILDEAKTKVGFTTRGDKILIQFYPSKDGGCEIFITKLAPPIANGRLDEKYENITVLEKKRTMYSFDGMDTLRRFARAAAGRSSIPASDAYTDESGICFLDIEEDCKKDADEYCYINEFAVRCSNDFRFYVKEHCTLIYEGNALGRLAVRG